MTLDLNDQAKAGALPDSPRAATRPMNSKAVESDATRPMQVYSVRELLRQSAERARTPLDRKGICPTGHYLLDEYTAGMRPGFTWVIAADTSVGKSSFIISVADETIKEQKRALIISSEDTENIYGDRLMARRSGVSADGIRKRRLSREDLAAMADVAERAEDVPVFVRAGAKAIEAIEKEIRAIIRNEKIDVVFFDYLQEFNSNKRHQDERVKFKHIAQVMREIIKSEGITGAILSQLTVTADTKVPNKHNIRECRDVANGAEVICLLFKPEEDIRGASPGRDSTGRPLEGELKFREGSRYVLLDKNKDGPPGKKIELNWNEHTACFDVVKNPEAERFAQYDQETEPDGGFDEMRFGN